MEEQNQKSLEAFPSNIQECINKVIENERYIKHNVFVRNISSCGNNFMGELYEVDVNGVTIDGTKEINIFVKQIINNEDFKVYSIPEVYNKEAYTYNELAEIYEDIQNDDQIPPTEKYKFVQSYKETNANAIILENITKRGYIQSNRFDLISLNLTEMSLRELAKFHALSFILERKRPEYFENKIKKIKQSFVYDKYWNEFVNKMCEISIAELNEETKERVKKFIPISLEKYPLYMTGGMCTIKCLCHGDYKMNNIMVKEENGEISDVLPIDYQQIYYGNPIIDVIYFIYAASDRAFRKLHLYHLRDFYYQCFEKYLNLFDIDVETVYPKKIFNKCFAECLDYALMFSLYFYPFFFASEEESHDGNDDLMEVTIKVDGRMKDRIQGVVDDFVEMGLI